MARMAAILCFKAALAALAATMDLPVWLAESAVLFSFLEAMVALAVKILEKVAADLVAKPEMLAFKEAMAALAAPVVSRLAVLAA